MDMWPHPHSSCVLVGKVGNYSTGSKKRCSEYKLKIKGFGTGAAVTLLQPTRVLWPHPMGAGEGSGQPRSIALPFYKQEQETLPKALLTPNRPQSPKTQRFTPSLGEPESADVPAAFQAAVTEHPGAENIYPPNGREGFG